jgi:hypothetical protein
VIPFWILDFRFWIGEMPCQLTISEIEVMQVKTKIVLIDKVDCYCESIAEQCFHNNNQPI